MRRQSVPLMVGILMGMAGICEADLYEWPVSSGGNGHFYEAILVAGGIDWESAQVASVAVGGYLTTITSATENAVVFDLVNDDLGFWIPVPHSGWPSVNIIYYEGPWLGGYRTPDGIWHWVTGEPFAYSNWAPGEPTVHIHNDQLQFFGINAIRSQWDNQSHGDLANGYIIEYDHDPSVVPVPGAVFLAILGLSYTAWHLRQDKKYSPCHR
jgi:hypothetical protein